MEHTLPLARGPLKELAALQHSADTLRNTLHTLGV